MTRLQHFKAELRGSRLLHSYFSLVTRRRYASKSIVTQRKTFINDIIRFSFKFGTNRKQDQLSKNMFSMANLFMSKLTIN